MNNIQTQSGKCVVAVGQPNSYARLQVQYDITLPKLISHIKSQGDGTGLLQICEADAVERQVSTQLVNAAYFYAKQ